MDSAVWGPAATVITGGAGLGFLFGWVAARSNFCTMGALSDVVTMGHWGRMRLWMLAVAVAVIATTALSLSGWVALSRSVPLRPTVPWLSLLLGGTVFGVGMTLAGGCANKNLVRLGGGSLRSLVVLVFMGLVSYITLKGLLAVGRVALLDPVAWALGERAWPDQSLGTALSKLVGLHASTGTLLAAALVSGGLLFAAFKDARFRRQGVQVAAGVAIGLLVAAGWLLTGYFGLGENEQLERVYFATNSRTLESLSFVAPVAYSLELLMLWSDRSLHASFGIAAVAGVVLGSATQALQSGSFRWEGFAHLADLRQQLLGAALMGFGGVTALGCTVGQGLSGLSTLALGSFVAVAGIVLGCVLTLRWMLRQTETD
jgi:uncharacterized protein